jgi:hypothetical protein
MILFKLLFTQLCKLRKSLIYICCFLSILYIFSKSKTIFCFGLGFFIASSISYINIYILSKSVCYILNTQVKKTKYFFFYIIFILSIDSFHILYSFNISEVNNRYANWFHLSYFILIDKLCLLKKKLDLNTRCYYESSCILV